MPEKACFPTGAKLQEFEFPLAESVPAQFYAVFDCHFPGEALIVPQAQQKNPVSWGVNQMLFRRFFCVSLLLCSLVLDVPRASLAGSITLEDDVTYGKGGEVELQLTLARPKQGEGPFPAVIFVHGGGWQGGNRSMYLNEIKQSARQGYVAVTISYRLTSIEEGGKPKYPFPAQIEDVKCAIRWLRANADKYKINPDRIGIIGESAGAHLALLAALTDSTAGFEGEGGHSEHSSRVQAVVNFYGPSQLVRCFETSQLAAAVLQPLLGGTPQEAAEQYVKASPLNYITQRAPPILTLHGDQDTIVPIEQGELLDARMKEAGVPHTLLIFKGWGHGFKGDAGVIGRAAMFAFLDKHLKEE
jgi:acetyl esterase/lipase